MNNLKSIMSPALTKQDHFISVYDGISKFLGIHPTVTMGTACKLYSGTMVDGSSDLDLIVPPTSKVFLDVQSTVSPCGTYRGLKKITEISGMTVEFLGQFGVTVNGEYRQFDESWLEIAILTSQGVRKIPITPSRDLRWFYEGMNRPKDQAKIEMLAHTLS